MVYKDIEKRRQKDREWKRRYRENNREKYNEDNRKYYKLRRSIDKEYGIDKSRKRRQAIREVITQKKKQGKCSRCGVKDWRVLDFHHINGKGGKKNNIARMPTRGVSIKRLEKEMNKCILLCKNCHVIIHYELKHQ